MKVNYVTGNLNKYNYVKKMLADFGVDVVHQSIHTTEIQSENYLDVALDKAQQSFEKLKEPLFVTDTAWEIPALGGFPGAYMKYVNKWFTREDFLNLMEGKASREIIAIDSIVYIDADGLKSWQHKIIGEFAHESYRDQGTPLDNLVKFEGRYLEEYMEAGEIVKDGADTWALFVEFLKSR